MSCVAPGCTSGYGRKKLPPGISSHKFPKDPIRRQAWIKAIKRKDWCPAENAIVCSLHFEESDFKTESSDTNVSRPKSALKSKRLKEDAIPRKFPGLPAYLSGSRPKERPQTALSASRFQQQQLQTEALSEAFLSEDNISSVADLKSKLQNHTFLTSWKVITYQTDNFLFIEDMSFQEAKSPTVKFSVQVFENLDFVMFAQDFHVPLKKVSHITKVNRISNFTDLLNILAFLNSFSDAPPPAEDILKDCINRLEKAIAGLDDVKIELHQKLTFIRDQLSLACQKPHNRRYSTSFLWSSITWMKTSAAAYKFMLNEGYITLPSLSHLKQLSSAFSLESGLSLSTIAYLEERIKHLSDREKVTSLLIDEVYTAQRVEYVGGSFYGKENGPATRTLLSFMVTSLGGNFDDLVCFIPTVTLNWSELMNQTMMVLDTLTAIGFEVVLLSVDGHKTNVKFFTELGKGSLEVSIPHPFMNESKLFTIFDPVHIFKNLFHNFERRRIFLFPPLTEPGDSLITASFQHLIDLFKIESTKPVKIAYKLSHRVLFPGPIERQNVQLAQSVFHPSTLDGLLFYSEHGHPEFANTAKFLSIVINWWKAANVKCLYHDKRKRDPFSCTNH